MITTHPPLIGLVELERPPKLPYLNLRLALAVMALVVLGCRTPNTSTPSQEVTEVTALPPDYIEGTLAITPGGSRFAYARGTSDQCFVISHVKGQLTYGPYTHVHCITWGPSGDLYFVATYSDGQQALVKNGVADNKVDRIHTQLTFAETLKIPAYLATVRGALELRVNGSVYPINGDCGGFAISRDASIVAIKTTKRNEQRIVVNGSPGPTYSSVSKPLVIEASGKTERPRVVYGALNLLDGGKAEYYLVEDGIPTETSLYPAHIITSTDGNKRALLGADVDEGSGLALWVDGQRKYDGVRLSCPPLFSHDGGAIAYVTTEGEVRMNDRTLREFGLEATITDLAFFGNAHKVCWVVKDGAGARIVGEGFSTGAYQAVLSLVTDSHGLAFGAIENQKVLWIRMSMPD